MTLLYTNLPNRKYHKYLRPQMHICKRTTAGQRFAVTDDSKEYLKTEHFCEGYFLKE